MNKKYFSILLHLLFFFSFLDGKGANHFYIEQYSTENQLPSNGIKGMQFDQSGFLWIGTDGGLVRFDGLHFETFSEKDKDLTSERVHGVIKSEDKKIYLTVENNSVYSVNANTITNENNKDIKDDLMGSSLLYSSFSLYKKLYKNAAGFNWSEFHIIPLDTASLLFYKDGQLFYFGINATKPIQLTSFTQKGNFFKLDKTLYFINQKSDIFKFILTEDLILQLIPQNAQLDKDLKKSNYDFFWENGGGVPLVRIGNKMWALENKNGITSTLICDSVPMNILFNIALYNKKMEKIFLGSDSKGLYIISKCFITSLNNPVYTAGITNATYSQFLFTENGSIYSSSGVVYGKKGTKNIITGKRDFYIYQKDSTHILFCNKGKISLYDFKNNSEQAISTTTEEGNTGFINYGSKTYIINKLGIGTLEPTATSYTTNYLIHSNAEKLRQRHFCMEIEDGKILIGSSTGLIRYNIQHNTTDTIFFPNKPNVRAIIKHNDYFLIGTYGSGGYIYRKGVYRKLPSDPSNFLDYCHCFVFDEYGNCWISTNRGLLETNKIDIENYYSGRNDFIYYRYFGIKDGMITNELNGGCYPCAIALSDTTISFPSMDGLVLVQPHELEQRNQKNDTLLIDYIRLGKKKVELSSILNHELDNDFNNLEIKFLTLMWENKESIIVQYKLAGTDMNWTLMDPANLSLTFNHLNYGNYKICVRKLNGFGNKQLLIEIPFSVGVPWYFLTSYLLLWILFLLVLAFISYRIILNRQIRQQIKLKNIIFEKTKEITERNEELAQKYQNNSRVISIISHDFIAPLRSVYMTSKNLLEHQAELDKELQTDLLREVVQTSKELEDLSMNIINWIKYQHKTSRLIKEKFNLHSLVKDSIRFVQVAYQNPQVKFVNAIDKLVILNHYPDPLKVILNNLISNAVKFTPKGEIRMSFNYKPNAVVLVVEDTGVGIDEVLLENLNHYIFSGSKQDVMNKKGNGLGYLIIFDLLKLLHGSFHIESQLGKGTSVFIEFPLDINLS